MLTKTQIAEIREHLNKAQNPVFYYDNDADGLCSYVLLRKYLGRGKGVAVKSYPSLDVRYAQRAKDFNSDYVFVLDKPEISEEFLQEIDQLQLPLIWIDHHETNKKIAIEKCSNLYIYNPTNNLGDNKSSEPVTYFSYKISNKKEDLWLALMGCIADHYLPDFAEDFAKDYPDLWKEHISQPFDAYYKTEIGKLAQAINFGLKDSITNVVAMQNFLIKCKSPRDVFFESKENESFRKKYSEIRKKYDALINKAKEDVNGNLIFFQYSGELSISSEISNELSYIFPGKYIAVAYIKGQISNISMRGNNVLAVLEKVLANQEHSSGGGHPNAVGARIRTENLSKFKETLIKEVNK